jgi:hypothetical protein
MYRVYYHEYDDSVPGTPLHHIKDVGQFVYISSQILMSLNITSINPKLTFDCFAYILQWKEGETQPPPDGPNQANAPTEEEYAEEDYTQEEPQQEEEEEYAEEEAHQSNGNLVQDDGAARLAKKRADADKAAKDKKAAEAKAKADARAPTKSKESHLYDAAKQAERRKSQKREELENEFSFAPQLATQRRPSTTGTKSSNRTSALYEHGKNKQQAELRRSAS